MSFGEDEEILQDFLVEAGEILELLSEQLVDLEQRPDDRELLNAIFRGFHTVKGGAGFLQLNALVDCCHITENLFDHLRNGKISVTTELMDVTLQALDAINDMFTAVQDRQEPTPADPALIQRLTDLVEGVSAGGEAAESVSATPAPEPEVAEPVVSDQKQSSDSQAKIDQNGDLSDAEFELFLDAIQDGAEVPPSPQSDSEQGAESAAKEQSDEISDDEFESLLDDIHGKGKHGGGAKPSDSGQAPSAPSDSSPAEDVQFASTSSDIGEDEFEALLDELHGGAAPGSKKAEAHLEQQPTAQEQQGVEAGATDKPVASSAGAAGDNLINDNEFEALLDQLHGDGKGPSHDVKKPASDSKVEPTQPAKAEASAVSVSNEPSAPAPTPKSAAAPQKIEKAAPKAAPSGRSAKESAASSAETTVRVDTQRLDEIMNMVGELVLVRNRLVRLGLKSGDEEMSKAVSNLDVVTADLQTSVMKTRMQPIKKVFGRFPRVVRDLARNMKKEISLELQGEETDLDKNLVEALADPLVHLVRNSVDHGIEMPDDRERSGKSRVGTVVLAAEQEGDHILLSITDDGAGMDPDKLRGMVVEKGLLDEDAAARLSDTECFNLIFMPGFSTKIEISDVSGRGVGMDVVKTKITQLNGSIEIQSKIGEGTRIIIKVPLTLAIMPTLMVMLGQQTFALPLVSVNEIFHMDLTRTNVVDGQEVVTVREKALPLFYLRRWLVTNPNNGQSESAHVVIVSVGTQRVGFVVDSLIGQEEVVIKPLGKMLQGTPGMAGATITGDGRIALILDVPSMLKRYAG